MANMLATALVVVSCSIFLMLSVQATANNSIQERFLLNHKALSTASTPSDSQLSGTEARIGGLNVYVSGSNASRRAVILASDVFGYKVANLRKIADKAAASGFFAVVPDFFNGDPFDGDGSHSAEWGKRHEPSALARAARPFVESLKRDLNMGSIGAAGFCYGAIVATELAKTDEIRGVVLLHPTNVNNVTDIGGVVQPIEILSGEKDELVNVSVIKNYEQILKARQSVVPSFVKIYPGAAHGWTTWYNSSDAHAVELADEAHRDMLNWFLKYVK